MSLHFDLQNYLFKIIAERYNSRTALVNDLASILQCSSDAVYRRLRGDTFLTPDQLHQLALHFKISIDRFIFSQTDNVMFSFNAFSKRIISYEDYISTISEKVQQLLSIPNVKIFYASLEIPIFYYCFFPELISFKLYVWGRSVWDMEFTRTTPFSPDLIPPTALDKAKDMLEGYLQIPSTHLWSLNIFDNTINQILYHLNAGGFKENSTALLLLDRLEQLCQHMKVMTEKGAKFHVKGQYAMASLEVHHNEMIYTNNTILIQSPYFNGVFTAFGNPNFLFSQDERIIAYTDEWFKSVRFRSPSITVVGSEKARLYFFQKVMDKIQQAKRLVDI